MKKGIPLDLPMSEVSRIIRRDWLDWRLSENRAFVRALQEILNNLPFEYREGDGTGPYRYMEIGEDATLRNLSGVPDRVLLRMHRMGPVWLRAIRKVVPYDPEYVAQAPPQAQTGPIVVGSGGPIEATITIKGPERAVARTLEKIAKLLREDTTPRT
jgi:hypothetical protein